MSLLFDIMCVHIKPQPCWEKFQYGTGGEFCFVQNFEILNE